jgi:WD40 repeat protein
VFFFRCTVVLFNPKKNRQSHILNISRKTITCLAFTADGRYLVTGECGHLPSVRVWDLQESGGTQIAEFPGHKYGINCVVSSDVRWKIFHRKFFREIFITKPDTC